MNEQITLICRGECGNTIKTELPSELIESADEIAAPYPCPICKKIKVYKESNKETVSFSCSGCGEKRRATIRKVIGQAKTKHHCKLCGKETVWEEEGWEEIEVE